MVTFDDRLTLDFGTDDPRFDQIEIIVRSVDIDTYMAVAELGAVPYDREHAEQLAALLAHIATSLDSWNLTDEAGDPVPLDVGGLRSLPKHLLHRVISAWVDVQAVLPAPFAGPSNDGAPPAEIPMRSLAS